MSYNFVNEATTLEISNECLYDTSTGYEADFSENGNLDGWDSVSLVHTYGAWNGFLFGTVYGTSGRIGRSSTFTPVPAESHYTVKISMKINNVSDTTPTTARLQWQTINDPAWDSDKSLDFTIYPDNAWHTYNLNMGNAQWWQGDVNDLRLYPILDGGDGDEFFIKIIKIDSVSSFSCSNPTCSFYNSYSHPCQGIGKRGTCVAQPKESNYFDIIPGSNDELIVNINGYGAEQITLASGTNISGDSLAKDLIKKLSQVDVGGYAEVNVTYSELGRFKIYSGTYTSDSIVSVESSSAAETLGFFSGTADASTKTTGEDPASGFRPKSSFKIKSFQLLELFDGSVDSYVEFNPFIHSVEGGRRDWAENGLGSADLFTEPGVADRQLIYDIVENEDKTIIDFNHPFNASGKITKIYLVGSLEAEDGSIRTGCKLKILRQNKEGQMTVVHTIDVPDRPGGGALYSENQEYVVVDCNLRVNKGDFLGAYNIDIYMGKSYSEQPDALYYQVAGEATGTFSPGTIRGDGNAGFFFYAHGEDKQKKLFIDIDLGKRVNIKDIDITGRSLSDILEYNIARCVDIDWQVDLFGGTHNTGYWDVWNAQWVDYVHANVAYGKDNLTDGICGNENGLAADAYSAGDSTGLVPVNPKYFYVNGDAEWVGVKYHVGQYKSDPYVDNFEEDPIAFTMLFPSNKDKTIFKSVMYFKDRMNFRTFALSTYLGPDITSGNADNSHFQYIPSYDAVTVDSVRYHEESQGYENVEAYLFENPSSASFEWGGDDGSLLLNNDAIRAADIVYWNVLTHEFGPIRCKGFRIFTDYHKSTKINELELYCYVDNVGTGVNDSVAVKYSQYEDLWLDGDPQPNEDGSSTIFVGSTPQYIRIEIEPVTGLQLSDLSFSISSQDVYVGDKGCEYQILLDHSKKGSTNQAKKIDFKNVYDKSFNFYADIPQDAEYSKGLTFYSKMNSAESILNPEIGPGAFYIKKDDYPLVLRDNNCAINCPVYGLKNIVDGAVGYNSIDGDYWELHGTVTSGVSVDFSNFKSQVRTVINIPVQYTDRYWKLGFSCEDQEMNIRETRIYDQNGNLLDYVAYHDPGVSWAGPVSSDAPHLDNGSLTGSYYVLENDSYLTFDVGGQESVTKIVLYNDNTTLDYSNSGCGIDRYTRLCLHCNQEAGYGLTDFFDSSYFPKTVHARGNTYIDNTTKFGNGAALFDGDPNTYLEVDHDDDFDFNSYRWAVDFWFKANSYPQEQTDWCYTISGTGTGSGNILNVNDHDRDTYFHMDHGTSVIVDWGTVQPIDTVYIKWWPKSNFNHYWYGKTSSGSWELFGSGGGQPGGSPSENWYLESRKYYSAIRLTVSASPGGAYIYDVRAITIDDDKDFVLAKNWGGKHPTRDWDSASGSDSWILLWRDYGNLRSLEFYARFYRSGWGNLLSSYNTFRSPSLTDFQHIALQIGPRGGYPWDFWAVYVNGSRKISQELQADYLRDTDNPIIFGKNVDGRMDEIRISRGDISADDNNYAGGARYHINSNTPFDHAYNRFYGVSLYTSLDNSTYGHYCDIDVKYEVDDPDVYYDSANVWSSPFNSYFAIDLGRRYALQIVRNYAGTDLLTCSLTTSTAYSNEDTSNINEVTFDGSYDDARWIRFSMYSGDSTDRYIRKLGVYPSLTNYIAPQGGAYNHLWDDLGTAITAYSAGRNVAFNATVSGSSEFGRLYLGKVVDGIVGDTITDAWGSNTSSTQWLEISFDKTYPIYRVMMYHGYSEDDSYLIEDYNIQVSMDGENYTTIFDITGNTEYEREHELSAPVYANSLKINITSYQTGEQIYLPEAGDGSYDYFQGACLREVEVNEYYGFDYISSEEYPIIAIDLLDQFQISGHNLIGIDPEDTSKDWDNSEGNFAWADSILDDPKKISFSSWGAGAHMHHDRWVAIKRNTATDLGSGPDYLKHAKILTTEDPDPTQYHWWWRADLSTLSNDYNRTKDGVRTLRVDYPTGSGIDHLRLVEGDTFGTDEKAAWRDALAFWLYIDDVDKLDDYGYIYFGDVNSSDYLEYRWDISFLKPLMFNGWNNMFLRFKSATDVLYVRQSDDSLPDPRIIRYRELKSFGMYFRGTGDPITMYIDSMKIERNQFQDIGRFDYGLYISGDDYVSAPLADFKLTQGTVEFWLRPDYIYMGADTYSDIKYRSLFHFANVPNDIFGAMIGIEGIIVYVGNLGEEPIMMDVEADYWNIDDMFHLAFVYSNDGTAIDTDGSTLRVYFNGYEIAKIYDTWDVSDSKKFRFFIGGKGLHAIRDVFESSSVDGVVSDFKIHNYCKTDFSDSLAGTEEVREKLWKPNELIEISKDNVTFYGVGDPGLPLLYEDVAPGNTASVYVRSSLPDTLTGRENREATILASWFVSI